MTEPEATVQPEQECIQVLVIDDEPAVRNILAQALATSGYFVYLADGNNVVESLDAREYDLIITDLKMLGTDGLQVLALAKEKSPGARLIVMTGYPSQESMRLCREVGVARYLVKPFAVEEIRQVARNVLESSNSSEEVLVSDRNHQWPDVL